MRSRASDIPGVIVFETVQHADERGHLTEIWRRETYRDAGIAGEFVQDNISCSRHGVLRGMHFQFPDPQAKLVYAIQGAVWDVCVDLRLGSPTFGQHLGIELSEENGVQVYLPEGMAHGFMVISASATVGYKATAAYLPSGQRGVRWDDPSLGIRWPADSPIVSPKDAQLPALADLGCEELVAWT